MTAPVAVILNPSSSGQGSRELVSTLLRQTGIEAAVHVLPRGADVTGLAKQLVADGARMLIAAGGDGTVSAVAAAVAGTGAAMGVLPLGGLNHFARDLGISLSLDDAARTLQAGAVRTVDVAEVNGRTFVNNSGLGMYPFLVTQREKRRRSGQRKWIAFFRAALATLRRFPFLDVRLTAGGKEFARRTPFVFVGANAYRMEGLHLGSRESLSGGLLWLGVAQYRMGRWGMVRLAFRALFGGIHHEPDLDTLSAREIHITSRHKRLAVSLDGEVAVLETPLHYRIRPGALRVIAP